MAVPTSSLPAVGVDARSISDQKIYNALQELQQILSQGTTGATADNLSTALDQYLGVSDSSVVRRGKSIIATTESRTNVAYGTLTTPDKVSSLVLPTDGLIFVAYQATWQESVGGAARAAIFLNGNEVVMAGLGRTAPATTDINSRPLVEASLNGPFAGVDRPLASCAIGLVCDLPAGNYAAYTGDVTTGQMVGASGPVTGSLGASSGYPIPTGGPCHIFAAAGTYDVSVQFKASSGSVTAKNRKLWVWTMGF